MRSYYRVPKNAQDLESSELVGSIRNNLEDFANVLKIANNLNPTRVRKIARAIEEMIEPDANNHCRKALFIQVHANATKQPLLWTVIFFENCPT